MKAHKLYSRHSLASIFVMLFFVLSFNSIGQGDADNQLWRTYNNPASGVTFEDLQSSFQEYWKDKEYQKGKGYKQFKRWENETKPRIYPSGDMTLPSSTYENFVTWQEENDNNRNSRSGVGPAWTELGPMGRVTGFDSGNGRLNMLRVDPNDTSTLYVGAADGGLWKSTNSGATWSTNTDFLAAIGVADLAIDPSNSNIMYLATGDVEGDRRSIGVLKTTNGGSTWNTSGLVWSATEDQKITKLLMDPTDSDIMLASTNKGVFRTTDGWDTWDSTALSVPLQDLEFKPGNSSIVYASGTEFYKSTNGGVSFTEITSGLPASDVVRMVIAVSADDANVVYAFCGKESDSGFLGLYRSSNSGTSFSTQSTTPNVLGFDVDGMDAGGQAFYDMALTASSDDANLVTVGGINQWQSGDGGVNWYMVSHWLGLGGNSYMHADVHEVTHMDANPSTMFTCCDGGLYTSTDYGATWSDISNNLAISQQNAVGISASTSDRMFSGLQDIGTIETDDVTTWNLAPGGGGDGEDCFIDRTDDNYIVVTGTNGNHELSTDGGISFNAITSGMPAGSGNADFFSAIRQHPILGDSYLAGGRNDFYRTDDNGNNWYAMGSPFGAGEDNRIKEFAVAPSDTSIVYATNSIYANNLAELSKSTDGGDTWTDMSTGLPVADISKIAVSNTDADNVWLTFSGYVDGEKVYKSVDGGTTWTNISEGLPNIPINTIVYENGSAADNIYIGAEIGVYFINNVTTSWIPYVNGLANAKVKDLRIFYASSPAKIRAATYGRGAWEVDVLTTPCNTTIAEVCVSGPCLFASGLYQAQNTISFTGDHSLANEGHAIFSAGISTTLSDGFGVVTGSVFEINTTGCTP